jgi:hypothetical protein
MSVLEAKRANRVNLSNARAWAKDVAAGINHDGAQCPIFARASQNMTVATVLLDTFLTPSADGVDKVYHLLKHILVCRHRVAKGELASAPG